MEKEEESIRGIFESVGEKEEKKQGVMSDCVFWFVSYPVEIIQRIEALSKINDDHQSNPNELIFWERKSSDGVLHEWGFTLKKIENLKKKKENRKEAWRRSWVYSESDKILKSSDFIDTNEQVRFGKNFSTEDTQLVELIFKIVREKKKPKCIH